MSAPPLPLLVIRSDSKLGKATTSQTKLRDVANKISMLLYGKKCGTSKDGILGKPAAFVALKEIRSRTYQVMLEPDMREADPVFYKYVTNMVNHANKNGVSIGIVWVR